MTHRDGDVISDSDYGEAFGCQKKCNCNSVAELWCQQ